MENEVYSNRLPKEAIRVISEDDPESGQEKKVGKGWKSQVLQETFSQEIKRHINLIFAQNKNYRRV